MPVTLTGQDLDAEEIEGVARHGWTVEVAPEAAEHNEAAWRMAKEVVEERPLYGRNTGVGARRDQTVEIAHDETSHGMRLLRSHAGGAGEMLSLQLSRAMLVVRANQIAAGGAGVQPELLNAIVDALNEGIAPAIHDWGALGTGDLTMLAEAGLALAGEGEWLGDGQPPDPVRFTNNDALALMSSNARTLGQAVFAHQDAAALLSASEIVATMSFTVIEGATEAFDERVQRARPHPNQEETAERLRALIGSSYRESKRLQDPFGYRCLPQVHGAARDALSRLEQILAVDCNASPENPLMVAEDSVALHNGNFHMAYLALALDQLRAAMVQVAMLSTARLVTLFNPYLTGLSSFLASGPPGSSGAMILEYTAQSALAEMRATASSAGFSSVALSQGLEDHASFATLAASETTAALEAYKVVVEAELVAAVRGLRMKGDYSASPELSYVIEEALGEFDADLSDHRLDGDLERAGEFIDKLVTGSGDEGDAEGDLK